MEIYDQTDLKLNVSNLVKYFKINIHKEEVIYFITRSHSGFIELLKIKNNEVASILSDIAHF